ncbi:Zinc finger SWIM-type [Arabidopsis suecica]|nr:Zinc finger SWIM-type [Arabidopsis suecica]KAG7572407.1 Zinc finger SWIM-type [Arabidopsis suecica]KAG7572409.1 Zinc finger SWIM-type [Arabidopsis suecica]KAG7572635.1 Zinc finger SWIM-type [Arabidopsis suecica]KAG7582609.1 Zinc finger SWIM-type [Arabidopsis suecica]
MSENVNIYFKCKGRMYTLMMKTSGENITLSMLVGRICTKLGLDESKVKLQLRYNAVLLGSTEEIYICDDEDVSVYISSGENNRRYVLYVEVITPPELPEQLSRVEVINKSSAGKNYEDEMRDNAAIVLCECEEQGTEPKEAIVEVDDTQDAEIGSQDESMDIHDDRGDEYVEPPPVVEAGQFKKEWEDLLLKTCSCKVFDIQKYPCVHALAGFIAFESDTTRTRSMEIHELVSKYYWAEMWALAYYRTIYLVPDKSQWDIPDEIKALKVLPLPRKKKKGRTKVLRLPSTGERRPKRQRTQNKRRPRQSLQWLLFGNHSI